MPFKKPMEFRVDDAVFVPGWKLNFSGENPGPFKAKGFRSFNILLDQGTADLMVADGWNVKCKLPDERYPEPFCFIEIQVKYRNREGNPVKPPQIVVISSKGRTNLTEETVGTLDTMDIKQVDLIATSYEWEVGDKSGISAYLKKMYVILDEDDLDKKYSLPSVEDKPE